MWCWCLPLPYFQNGKRDDRYWKCPWDTKKWCIVPWDWCKNRLWKELLRRPRFGSIWPFEGVPWCRPFVTQDRFWNWRFQVVNFDAQQVFNEGLGDMLVAEYTSPNIIGSVMSSLSKDFIQNNNSTSNSRFALESICIPYPQLPCKNVFFLTTKWLSLLARKWRTE